MQIKCYDKIGMYVKYVRTRTKDKDKSKTVAKTHV